MCCFDTIADSRTCCGVCRLEGGSGITMTTDDDRSARGSRVALEAPTELVVLARVEAGAVVRVRTFTPDCDVDANGAAMVWLTDVKPDESIAWLSTLATSAPDGGERRERVAKQALAAIALHNVPAADRALESFVATAQP